MKLKTYRSRYTKEEQREMLKKTKIKMDELDRKLKGSKKKRRKKRSSLGGRGLGVSAQRGVDNFLGMLRR